MRGEQPDFHYQILPGDTQSIFRKNNNIEIK